MRPQEFALTDHPSSVPGDAPDATRPRLVVAPVPPVRALLFDIGEVVIRLDWLRAFAIWGRASGTAPERLAARFAQDDAYRAFERGEIAAADYYAALRERLDVALDDATIEDGWNAIFVGLQQPVVAAIRQWRQRLPVYAFSNTNPVHRHRFMGLYGEQMGLFHRFFDSSQIGARKPDAVAFQRVLDTIGLPAGDVLFFDDLAPNVDAARELGLRATLVREPGDVLRTLALLPGG